MNPAPAHAPVSFGGAHDPATPQYTLTSDIAQFCLPAFSRDASRRLAYVNSICFMFLVIGIIGFREPKIVERQLPPVVDIVPVVYTPPPEQPKPEPQTVQEEPEVKPDTTVDMPQIATVVATDPTQARFAVPVEGPVVFAPAKFAQAPPPSPPKTTTSSVIRFTGTDGGTYPKSDYPAWARIQGQVQEASGTLLISVNPDGTVSSVEIKEYSGSNRLARYAADWVKKRFKFPPVDNNVVRIYEKPFSFELGN
jgi:outer membrane biosynthesis protein TonB